MLGAPILIWEIHEADDVKVVAEDVAAVSKKRHEVEETSNGLTVRRRHRTDRRRHGHAIHGRRRV